jgi:quinol monooxygenase YgiN
MNRRAMAAVATAALLLATSASSAMPAATYVATYLEFRPASIGAGEMLARRYVRATRAAAGNVGINALQEIGRSNRFLLLETWTDHAAFAEHETTAATVEFREQLKLVYRSPYDQRIAHGFAVDPSPAIPDAKAIYVVTHVDVPGARREAAERVLEQLFQASDGAPGHVRYDIYQQDDPRTNHFTMFAVWNSRPAVEAYDDTPQWLQFREALAPLLGAPFDERFYRLLGP